MKSLYQLWKKLVIIRKFKLFIWRKEKKMFLFWMFLFCWNKDTWSVFSYLIIWIITTIFINEFTKSKNKQKLSDEYFFAGENMQLSAQHFTNAVFVSPLFFWIIDYKFNQRRESELIIISTQCFPVPIFYKKTECNIGNTVARVARKRIFTLRILK